MDVNKLAFTSWRTQEMAALGVREENCARRALLTISTVCRGCEIVDLHDSALLALVVRQSKNWSVPRNFSGNNILVNDASNMEDCRDDDKHLEKQEAKSGDHPLAGAQITKAEDSAVKQRQEMLDVLKSHRITTDGNAFTIDMGDGGTVQDVRAGKAAPKPAQGILPDYMSKTEDTHSPLLIPADFPFADRTDFSTSGQSDFPVPGRTPDYPLPGKSDVPIPGFPLPGQGTKRYQQRIK
jgi:hypothetical protein